MRPDCWVSISKPDSPETPVERLSPAPAALRVTAAKTQLGVPAGTEVSLLLVGGTVVDGLFEEVVDSSVRIANRRDPVPLQEVFDVLIRVDTSR